MHPHFGPEENICNNCRNYIYLEIKEYSGSEEKQIFNISDFTKPTENTLEIFKTLATLYVGGASIIQLKTPIEGYFEEIRQMNIVSMTNMLAYDSQDKNEKNKMIKLGPDQNKIFMSGIGLHQSYAVIAPWGGGKSMLLELELHRTVELHNISKEPVTIFLVVYEMKATNLLQHYQTLVADLKKKENIQIKVMNLREICKKYSLKHENR